MRKLLFAASLLTLGPSLRAAEPCVTLDQKAVAAMFDDWNFALSSLDANQVAQRYWPNAVLLPTVSNTPRTSPAMISDYFQHFLVKRPRGRIDTRTIQSGCNMAMDVGTYTFSLMDDKGQVSEVAARYTFVYEYHDGAWKILHHHSSAMPESGAGTMAVEEKASNKESAQPLPVKAEPKPASWRERRAKSAGVTKAPSVAAAPVVAKSDAKSAANSKTQAVAEARPAAAKPATDAKPAADTKAVADTKPAVLAKPGELAQPAEDANPREVKTAMFANLTASPPPSKFYPVESARRKERGNVNLKVCADGTGAVGDKLEVLKSSGSKLLDEAAMTWARAATWVPATMNRRRVEGCTSVDVTFEAMPVTAANSRT